MPSSGVTTFFPDVAEILEEAYERVRPEGMHTGYDVRTGRRSLNLLMLEWANRQINLWTIDSFTVPLVAGTATYTLAADTVDLLDSVVRTTVGATQSDIPIGRMSLGEYANIPNKQLPGRPVRMYVDRQGAAPTVTVWPVPDGSVPYSLVCWRMRRVQDSGNVGTLTMDVPARLIPAMIAGLAYYLSFKFATDRTVALKAAYDEQFQLAIEEDRDRSSFRVQPRIR